MAREFVAYSAKVADVVTMRQGTTGEAAIRLTSEGFAVLIPHDVHLHGTFACGVASG